MGLVLHNTLTRRKEELRLLEPSRVRMYHCGPTVYGYAHIGNFASFLLADLLRRHLEFTGHAVLQVMNITDVGHLTEDSLADARGEDKLERKAREERKNPWEIARFYERAFQEDREFLNILPAHHYPRATEHVPEMVEMIGELLEKGLAYLAGGQVYFEIARFPRYGILSGNTPEELLAGAGNRVEDDPHKRNPLDFTLWKKDPRHIMQWDSPWGRGFPGWHIECSAMSRKYLGAEFDIHTGGEDNIFPHHECEIAQSSGGTDRMFARHWLHRRHILVDQKKMSKSEGNFFTVRDLAARGYSGLEIRHALLSGHYRAQLNFSLEGLEASREALRRLRNFLDDMRNLPPGRGPDLEEVGRLGEAAEAEFLAGMNDDLNVSLALAAVFGFVRDANRAARSGAAGAAAAERVLRWDRVLGLLGYSFPFQYLKEGQHRKEGVAAGPASTPAEPPGPSAPARPGRAIEPADVDALLRQRDEARRARDFARADAIRKELLEKGVTIKDTPQGTRWTYD